MISPRLLSLASVLFLLLWPGQPGCFGQDVIGYTAVLQSTNSSEIDGYSLTETSYAVANYYDAGVIGYLYDGASQVDAKAAQGYVVAGAYPTTSSVHQGDTYTLYSEHYLIAYYYTPGYGFYNPYQYYPGAGFAPGEGYAPGYSFTPGGGPPVVQQQNIYLGYTYLQFATAPPHVSSVSPQSVVRGTSGSFYLQGSNLQDDFGVFTVRALDGDSLAVASSSQTTASLNYTIAPDATVGTHRFTVSNTWGESEPVSFTVVSAPPSVPPPNPCAVTSNAQSGYSSIVPTGTAGGSGTVAVSFSGTAFAALSPIVTYGPYSTPSSIAANIAALITKNYFEYGLSAKAFGSNVVYSGYTTLGTVNNMVTSSVAVGPSFTTNTSSTTATAVENACGAAPPSSPIKSVGTNPCSGANPANLNYNAINSYNAGDDTAFNHIYKNHIIGSPPKSIYSGGPGGIAGAVGNMYRLNALTLRLGILVEPSIGGIAVLSYYEPPMSFGPITFGNVGTSNGQPTQFNTLVVLNCTIPKTSYPGLPSSVQP